MSTSASARPRSEGPSSLDDDIRGRVEAAVAGVLAEARDELARSDPRAAVLADEISRLVAAGGKRVRPLLCVWAFRAASGEPELEDAAVRAAAGLELLHTFALVHDDVMDDAVERRGVETTHVRFERAAPGDRDGAAFGTSVAILAGDLAAVLAERTVRGCGAPAERLDVALERFDRMRVAMAAGQYLDVEGSAPRERVAALKTGAYTAEGPVGVGTALAGAAARAEAPLLAFARLVGEAFQLRDDVIDGDAPAEDAARVDALVQDAVAALEGTALRPDAVRALAELASGLRLGER
jgi:geranylgeranyl diphosphate synthase type I